MFELAHMEGKIKSSTSWRGAPPTPIRIVAEHLNPELPLQKGVGKTPEANRKVVDSPNADHKHACILGSIKNVVCAGGSSTSLLRRLAQDGSRRRTQALACIRGWCQQTGRKSFGSEALIARCGQHECESRLSPPKTGDEHPPPTKEPGAQENQNQTEKELP